jgi:uncharacterized Tic20 family protein
MLGCEKTATQPTQLVFVIIGLFLPGLVVALNVVFCLIAAITTSKGEAYRYPLSFEFIKS